MTDSISVPILTTFINNFFTLTHQFYANYRTSLLIFTGTALSVWLYNRLWTNRSLCPSLALMTGKTVVITGGNSGIGYETAKELAIRGARVIIASRNVERGQIAVDTLREKTGSKQIEFMQCDLCSLDSVRKFCKTFNENESRLDCLINNAGLVYSPDVVTKDGYNSIIQANYLGHFLLTNLLLDKLKQCKPSRIVNVSSGLHYSVKHIDWNDIFSQFKDRSLFGPYSSSKAFQIMFTKKLKDDLGKAGVNSFATNPGWVWTSIQNPMREAIGLLGFLIFYPLLYAAKIFFAQNSKTGAQTTIYCAVASELINSNEVYFANFSAKQTNPVCLDSKNTERLWKLSSETVGLEPNSEI